MVRTQLDELRAFMTTKGIQVTTVAACWQYFKSLTRQDMDEYKASGKVYYVTQGPRDIVYVPPNFVVSEKVGCVSDCLGYRWAVVVPDNQRSDGAVLLKSLAAELGSSGKDSALVDELVAKLAQPS